MTVGTVDPIVKTITVDLDPERAFALFTDGIDTWWPLDSHSIGGSRSVRCVLQCRAGGDVYEVLDDGTRHDWGRVTAWEPPSLLRFTWHPGRSAETEQVVEVVFAASSEGCTVTLTHSGWEALGSEADKTRQGYDTGWDRVFCECYSGACR